MRQRREPNIVQLGPIQTTMIVSAAADWCRQNGASRVKTLVNTLNVTPSGNFLDKDRCETLVAEFLVDAEEVDFRAEDGGVADAEVDGDAGDESDELAGGGGAFGFLDADTNVPVFTPRRSFEGPIVASLFVSNSIRFILVA